MLGKLNKKQIEDLLKQQVTGRVACHAEGDIYIVPVNYVYDGSCIMGHSSMGKKIEMMRKNPEVCFQVDQMESLFRWKSVIAWGRFKEVTDEDEKQQVMQALIHRIMPLADRPSNHPFHGITEQESEVGSKVQLIVYKIKLRKKTGRFENDLLPGSKKVS
ncbi:pyridoxamine 5'-phosphate oxidase family protein [soil metagenome]|jgi:nitroimidazol reductase NimA-like FMN-containing flavoprotein (pyridoxamine 5'-phosphate oxidase superfamily)